MAATYVVGSSYIRLLGSPLSDLGTPLCNIYLLSNHVMKTQTYCSCSIILMIVRYIQCVNNIEGNILDISLSLSTTKKIRRKDYLAGRRASLASLCPSKQNALAPLPHATIPAQSLDLQPPGIIACVWSVTFLKDHRRLHYLYIFSGFFPSAQITDEKGNINQSPCRRQARKETWIDRPSINW